MYHGILLNKSFIDESFPKQYDQFNKIEFDSSDWVVYGVEINDESIDSVVKDTMKGMKEGPYFNHSYNDEELIIIYPKRIFTLPKNNWNLEEAIAYGKSLKIPEDQLNFEPFRFEDESSYFSK